MSGMNLQRREASKRGWLTVASGTGTVLSFIFLHWLLGIILLGLTGFLGWRYFKHRATWGMRF
ncbi:MAG: hypothetical protein ACOX8U_09480 [Bradymonadia bacterium]|jgi:uncharacterized membrane protein YdbT with pleckstrin-like domain